MAVLHDELNRRIAELCASEDVELEFLRCVFQRHGVALSDAQLQSVAQAMAQRNEADNIVVDVNGWPGPQSLSLNAEEIALAAREVEERLEERVQNSTEETVEQIAPQILASLYRTLPRALREWQSLQSDFEKQLRKRWKKGLDRLEMLIVIANEAGETHLEDLRLDIANAEVLPSPALTDVLVALHVRACRTAREILCLLKSGYADGANARWRSLHEVAVTALFMQQHGEDVSQQYLDHAAVEVWRAASQYQTHCGALGYEPYSDEELAELESASAAAVSKYGKSFGGDYGWAANALGIKKPTFSDIESNVDLSQWRPFFKHACQSVHAGSQGLFCSLAIPAGEDDMLIAGASDSGLADPGHRTAISLMMASSALLTTQPTLDALVACKCMLILCDEIGTAMLEGRES